MIFRYVFCSGGLSRLHSPDVEDMRRAIGTEYLEDHTPDALSGPRRQTSPDKANSPG